MATPYGYVYVTNILREMNFSERQMPDTYTDDFSAISEEKSQWIFNRTQVCYVYSDATVGPKVSHFYLLVTQFSCK
jgi:hypothetical protein